MLYPTGTKSPLYPMPVLELLQVLILNVVQLDEPGAQWQTSLTM